MSRTLRSVPAGERVVEPRTKRTPRSVSEAAASGDPRALLVAMRSRIARTVSDPKCPPRDLAALTLRLQNIAKEIEAMDLRRRQEGEQDGEPAGDAEFSAEAL